jgi:hypothetical protein
LADVSTRLAGDRPGSARLGRGAARIVGLAIAALVGGCAHAAEAAHPVAVSGSPSAASPSPSRERLPVGYAGGACQLLDYAVLETAVGTRFDVAASSQSENTFTCVLQPIGASFPDLALSVTATELNPTTFKSSIVPKGATSVPKLGKAAYSLVVPAGAGAGPSVVVGWLSDNDRLILLRYRCPPDAVPAAASALVPRLVALAKQVDAASI